MDSIKTNLSDLLIVSPDAVSPTIASTFLETKQKLRNLKTYLQKNYKWQDNILREKEKNKHDLLDKAINPDEFINLGSSHGRITEGHFQKEAPRPTKAQQQEKKVNSQKDNKKYSSDLCPDCKSK